MPPQMIACPHCGTDNSARRRVCYHCQQEMTLTRDKSARPASAPVTPAAELAITLHPPVPPPPAPRNPGVVAMPGKPGTRPPADAAARQRRKGASPFFGIPLPVRAQFYRQMYGLLHAGIPLSLALSYQRDNTSMRLRHVVDDLIKQVQGGGLISRAMEQYPNIFPDWEMNIIRAGEMSGTLPEAMHDIATALEKEYALRQQVNSSTLHLKITVLVFIFVVMFVSGVHFGPDMQVNGGGIVSWLATTALRFFVLVVGGLAAIWLAWRALGRTRAGSAVIYNIMCRLPLVGPLNRNIMRVRFIRSLAALWHAGVPPMHALDMAVRTTNRPHIIRRAEAEIKKLGEGATLSEVLANLKILTPEILYIIQSGETSGTITDSLSRAAEYIQVDLDAQAATLPTKAQLLFYAIVAPAVAYFVISFYAGYFNMFLKNVP